jgi:hypothetical protein
MPFIEITIDSGRKYREYFLEMSIKEGEKVMNYEL